MGWWGGVGREREREGAGKGWGEGEKEHGGAERGCGGVGGGCIAGVRAVGKVVAMAGTLNGALGHLHTRLPLPHTLPPLPPPRTKSLQNTNFGVIAERDASEEPLGSAKNLAQACQGGFDSFQKAHLGCLGLPSTLTRRHAQLNGVG